MYRRQRMIRHGHHASCHLQGQLRVRRCQCFCGGACRLACEFQGMVQWRSIRLRTVHCRPHPQHAGIAVPLPTVWADSPSDVVRVLKLRLNRAFRLGVTNAFTTD